MLLLPTATYRAAAFVDAAAALDAEVVVASERRQALARSMGDRALVVSFSRPEAAAEAIVALAGRVHLDAVVAVDDQGVLVAALAAERLGLSHNPPAAVARARDKVAMRSALDASHIPQPRWAVARAGDDVGAVAATVGFPCVVKPTTLSASTGVIRADDAGAARSAGARSRAIASAAGAAGPGAAGDAGVVGSAGPAGAVGAGAPSSGGPSLIVESFVPGAEVALEGLLRGGHLDVLAIFDKPDPMEGPYFEETIYVTPSRLAEATLAEVRSVTASACAAMGLVEGPVHAELRVGRSGVSVIEVAARSIGGLCSRALSFGTGVSLETLIVAHALGLPSGDLRREKAASGVVMLPIPAAGVLVEVAGRDRALAVPGVTGLEISIPPGRAVVPLPEGNRYLGFVFARAPLPALVEEALRNAQALLQVRIEPSPAS